MPDLLPSTPAPGGEFLFYQTGDGRTRLQVRVEDETVFGREIKRMQARNHKPSQ